MKKVMYLLLFVLLSACNTLPNPTQPITPPSDADTAALFNDSDLEAAVVTELQFSALSMQAGMTLETLRELSAANTDAETLGTATATPQGAVAYVSHNTSTERWRVFVAQGSNAHVQVITSQRPITSVAVSADANKVLFTRQRGELNPQPEDIELWQITLEPREISRLTVTASPEAHASLSADGQTMVWEGTANGQRTVFVVTPDASFFLETPTVLSEPRVNARGDFITFGGTTGGLHQLLRYEIASNQTDVLAQGSQPFSRPSISADGNLISYQSQTVDRTQVRLLNVSEVSVSTLLNTPQILQHHVLNADGDKLLFALLTADRSRIVERDLTSNSNTLLLNANTSSLFPSIAWAQAVASGAVVSGLPDSIDLSGARGSSPSQSFTLSASGGSAIVNFSAPAGFVVTPASLTLIPGTPQTVTVAYDDSAAICTILLNLSLGVTVNGETSSIPLTLSTTDSSLTGIYTVQGSGLSTPLAGQTVTVEGVVTADFQKASELTGFFLQDIQGDGDPETSDGIFVYQNDDWYDVSVGQVLRVTGVAGEHFGNTQISNIPDGGIVQCGYTSSVEPVVVTLPVASTTYLERYEGMLVSVTETLTVTEVFGLGRFGEVVLTNGPRLYTPTSQVLPGAAANAFQAQNNLNRLVLDDGSFRQNPDPLQYPTGGLSASNTLRVGDSVSDITGVFYFSRGSGSFGNEAYRLHPTVYPTFSHTNPRPAAPVVAGSLTVAPFNVLNYFTTIDQTGAQCFPTMTRSDCRGADSALEFTRQRTKIISAIVALDADVVGLMEIENNPTAAVADLVAGLNAVMGEGTYSFIDTGRIGTDAIKLAIIYKPATVTPLGNYAILTTAQDPRFQDNRNRPPLAQTFRDSSTGGNFTVVVNHLKSKGSACGASDPDMGDGQGNCNLTRRDAALAIADWLETHPTGIVDEDYLIIGDLNAYTFEDPIRALEDAGYTNLIRAFNGLTAHSYVFDGQSGYLDHALATSSMTAQVVDLVEWNINSDEPIVLDYNLEFKTANQQNLFYAPDAYRSSDHDPVIIGLNLTFDEMPVPAPDYSLTLSANSLSIEQGSSNSTLTATVSPVNSFNDTVALSFSAADGITVSFNPASISGSGQSSLTVSVANTVPASVTPYTVTVTGTSGELVKQASFALTVTAPPSTSDSCVVISQVYGGGGNSGATHRNDFIELFNRCGDAQSIAGWSVQYASAGGNTWNNKVDLSNATLQPGGYYLISLASGGTAGVLLPTADQTGNINMSASAGKVALVSSTTQLTCGSTNNCTSEPTVLDFVGFGTTASSFEGSAPTANLSATTAAIRKNNGCTDANDNASDFNVATPTPRNSSSSANTCTP